MSESNSDAKTEIGEPRTERFFDGRTAIAQALFRSRDRRVLLDGPLGTGKTRLLLEKVWACCRRYPGCRWLLARSVRRWLTHSALVTWEDKVVLPKELIGNKSRRENRVEYQFDNHSSVVVAGLDDPQRVFSAEFDGAALIEAIELDRDTAEKVDGRLRNGRMPYQQLLMDCNPGPPTHWLHRAFESGWCRRLPMRHTDNPTLYGPDGLPTAHGESYIARLDDMSGVRRARLRDGKWVQAEGVVYDRWDPALHVIDPFRLPVPWRRFWAIDFGFTCPLVWQWWAEDADGRIYLYREIYQTGRLVKDVAQWAERLSEGEPRPTAVVCDHDPEAIATIARCIKVPCTAADKVDRKGGIQQVANRLLSAGDGRPRLFLFRDALAHPPDPALLEAGRPTRTELEFNSYVWEPTLARGEEPKKENDHGMDCVRYLCRRLEDQPRIAENFYD